MRPASQGFQAGGQTRTTQITVCPETHLLPETIRLGMEAGTTEAASIWVEGEVEAVAFATTPAPMGPFQYMAGSTLGTAPTTPENRSR